jgi:hypothetical protein
MIYIDCTYYNNLNFNMYTFQSDWYNLYTRAIEVLFTPKKGASITLFLYCGYQNYSKELSSDQHFIFLG